LENKGGNSGVVKLRDVGEGIGIFYDCKENKGREYSEWELNGRYIYV
jgi:hypothetical protein